MMAGREPHEHGYSVWVSANYMYIVRGGDDPSGAFTQRHKVLLAVVVPRRVHSRDLVFAYGE